MQLRVENDVSWRKKFSSCHKNTKRKKSVKGFDRFFFSALANFLFDADLLAPAALVIAELDDVEARRVMSEVDGDALALREVV